jgi:uncharacterized protein YraI
MARRALLRSSIECWAVAVALSVGSGTALATADGPDHFVVQGVAANDVLNIRAGPSSTERKLGQIPSDGNCIRNLGCQGGLTYQEFSTLSAEQRQQRERVNPRWCRIEYLGVTGWVAGRYLGEGSCAR